LMLSRSTWTYLLIVFYRPDEMQIIRQICDFRCAETW